MSNIEKQQTTPKKQHIVVVKVISAMTLFLLGLPFLMFLATSYYTTKGLAMDVYLMGQEYTNKVDQFYKENNACPANQDIISVITELDITEKINFLADAKGNTCYIALSLKSLNGTFTNKVMVLGKTFNTQLTTNTAWNCYSNIHSIYLPKNCSTDMPKNTQINK
ncbi:hypothetical protein DM558_08720 [Entomomonas moraniae]|uniref:Pilin n=1 Tax=Entomomonas moraniae TaxID=2213226 RepID=A0A3Q9JLF5_9GAMM|nr:pilin [Entomomonas moraniae]AZS50859.1 hypothetical protein DM558_08720 [Entomomonas moraniae]